MKLTWFRGTKSRVARVDNVKIVITLDELAVTVERHMSIYPGEREKTHTIDMRHSPVIMVYEFLCVFNLEEHFGEIITQHFQLRRELC